MKIEYNDNFFITPIENVQIGECFLFNGKLHMKLNDDGYVEVNCYYPNLILDLSNNKLNAVANGVIVNKINAKIVVG